MDERLRDLARRSPNFGVLFQYQPLLALYGALAEATVFTNPNAALVQAGQFGEVLAEELVTRVGLRVDGDRQLDRLNALTRVGAFTPEVRAAFDDLRTARNSAAHQHLFDTVRALRAVETSYELGNWFHLAISGKRTVRAFVPPTQPAAGQGVTNPVEIAELREALEHHRQALTLSRTRLEETRQQQEGAERRAQDEAAQLVASAAAHQADLASRIEQLESEIDALRSAQQRDYEQARRQPTPVARAAREAIVERAQRPKPLNEIQAREVIDQMLIDAGWKIQDREDLNPLAGRGVAVREFTVATGRADYVLYVDGSIVGVVEAKREGEVLSRALAQNDRYARGVLKEFRLAVWREDEPFAFRYATTGSETYFLNRLDPDSRSRQVFAFHRPETVATWMRRSDSSSQAPTFRAALRSLPELETGGLRSAQVEAIEGLEGSLAEDRPRALIQMATGAGKTFTAVTQTYRLLKYAQAKRVLFLVDRNNLAKQALAEFRNYTTPDDGRKFSELYGVDRLGAAGLQETSSVVICTIQKMYSLLRGQPLVDDDTADDLEDEVGDSVESERPVEVAYNPAVPIESFDLIVVDECHRSIYGLWRGVLEYFDAHLVGLTATPTPQTKGFFNQNLVSSYSFAKAVADGVNVDFDVVELLTDVHEEGATIEAGTTIPILERASRRRRLEELEDDFSYSGKQLGRNVIAEDDIRTVLQTYRDNWQRWFPGRKEVPKTLIFAVSEAHAEEVLRQAKEVFGRGDDFASKITYKSRQNGQNPDDLINELRNSPQLRIAVTVDMIATGTDVRALECVIFMRSVKSAVLFEQMKGRGARSIDETELREVTPGADESAVPVTKDRFLLIDAAGVTRSQLVDAAPLPTTPGMSLRRLLDKAGSGAITAEETDVLARRLGRLGKQLTNEQHETIAHSAGGLTLVTITRWLTDACDPFRQEEVTQNEGPEAARRLIRDAVAPLADSDLRKVITGIRRDEDLTIDEVTVATITTLREVPREERARKYITDWHTLLDSRRDELTAIEIALGQQRVAPEAAYAALRELAAYIKRPQYDWTPQILWQAYEDLGRATLRRGKTAGIPDLISLIRYELGAEAELQPYQASVEQRFAGWLLRQQQAGATYSRDQLWWLERICDRVASDIGVEVDALRDEPFIERGGSRGFIAAFGGDAGTARKLLMELNQELV
ncbi:DEAD/DEAH box helicase family protein [Streptomyces sp. ISL-94]|uniref:type I restriction endonuclease subunit R n=1 Tax=Streptomyces sp. ISL-94 TaxID=2819190 RepID=UPI001BE8FA0B|nr:DEAD/DEAH box helicase family protein [Streptomyces sp. ISL-94]MBT2478709.1 DEAD/DEAH box helicase family protein [Streptomyces sp. ISL-94]